MLILRDTADFDRHHPSRPLRRQRRHPRRPTATTPPAPRSTSSTTCARRPSRPRARPPRPRRSSPPIRDAGLRIAPQGSRHNPAPLGDVADTMFMQLRPDDAGRARRHRRAPPASRRGARWWDLIDQASEAGLRRPPRLLARDQHRRLLARWRRRLARAQARPADQRRDGDRDRHRRRRAPRRRRRQRAGAVLGAARRRRQLRRRHRDRVRARAAEDRARRRAVLSVRALGRGPARIPRVDRAGLPDEITSVGRTLQLPDLPEIPEIVRGKSFAIIEAISVGDIDADPRAARAAARARARRWTRSPTCRRRRCSTCTWTRSSRSPTTAPTRCSSEFTERAIDEALAAVGPGTGSPVSFEVRHLGGALSRSDASHGALDTMRGEYMMFGRRPDHGPGDGPADRGRPGPVVDAAFAPDDSGRYLNFTEVAHDVEDMFPTAPSRGCATVKNSYDPEGLVQSKSRGLSTAAGPRSSGRRATASRSPRPLRFP